VKSKPSFFVRSDGHFIGERHAFNRCSGRKMRSHEHSNHERRKNGLCCSGSACSQENEYQIFDSFCMHLPAKGVQSLYA
jgi:hypothetical protein